jgi:hypothetical protein
MENFRIQGRRMLGASSAPRVTGRVLPPRLHRLNRSAQRDYALFQPEGNELRGPSRLPSWTWTRRY